MQHIDVQKFRSTDVSEIEETWREFVPSAELMQVDELRCSLDWHSISMAGMALIKYEMAADVRSIIEPAGQLFTCQFTTSDGGIEDDRRHLDPRLPWASDGREIRGTWRESASVQALVFDRDYAQEQARLISGDDTLVLRVDRSEAVCRRSAAQWQLTFDYVLASLAGLHSDEPRTKDLIIAGLQRQALLTVFSSFATTFSEASRRSAQSGASPQTVKRAIAFIDANAHLPITIDDVARASHISTRGLQYAFKRAHDISPNDYLRRVRLAGARDALLAAEPGDSLAAIAKRWGFSNVSRFTATYRSEYGRHPGELLKHTTTVH